MKRCVYLLENEGLKVTVTGRGKVFNQSIVAGTTFKKRTNSFTHTKMMLQDILYKVRIRLVKGNTSIEVKDLQVDSRKVSAGSCFIAIKGTAADGHLFIDKAIENGATAIVCEAIPTVVNDNITYIEVENSAIAAGFMSHNFYDEPSLQIKLVGVTGTNGKTTIVTLLWKLFTALDYKCGLISTVQNQIGETVIASTHTTPDAISINALLKQMADAKCEYVFMECSSHAIHLHRITGLNFTGAIFSNITHDHLDYHKTFDEYIRVKKISGSMNCLQLLLPSAMQMIKEAQ
ncbi:MAG: Mur ligase family protein [Ferruginibacter sp.]